MYMLFVDESGTPPPEGKANSSYFVLAGLVIGEADWWSLSVRFSELLWNFGVEGEIKWRFFSPYNNRPDNSLLPLSPEERDGLRSGLLEILRDTPSCRVIAAIVNIDRIYRKRDCNSADDLYQIAYREIVSRFQFHLQDVQKSVGGRVSGIVICDHRNPRSDKRLTHLHEKMVSHQDHAIFYNNLIEGLFMVQSHLSMGVQLADIVAGALYRKAEHNDDRYYSEIETIIRKSPRGGIKGFGIIPVPDGRLWW